MVTGFSESDFIKWASGTQDQSFRARLQLPIVSVKRHTLGIPYRPIPFNCGGIECPACLRYKESGFTDNLYKRRDQAYANVVLHGENRFRIFQFGKHLHQSVLKLIIDYKPQHSGLYNACLIPTDKNPMRLSFLSSIIKDGKKDALLARLAYADWLEEQGEEQLSEAVRLTTVTKKGKKARFLKLCNELKLDTHFVNIFNGIDLSFSRTVHSNHHGFPSYEVTLLKNKPCPVGDFDEIVNWKSFDLSSLVKPGDNEEIRKIVERDQVYSI